MTLTAKQEKLLNDLKKNPMELVGTEYRKSNNKLKKISKKDLLAILLDLQGYDEERGHYIADYLLLSYIGDEDIKKAFNNLSKWYS